MKGNRVKKAFVVFPVLMDVTVVMAQTAVPAPVAPETLPALIDGPTELTRKQLDVERARDRLLAFIDAFPGAMARATAKFEALARQRGKARMDLTTARSNHAAQALYESLGWTRDEVFLAYSRALGD